MEIETVNLLIGGALALIGGFAQRAWSLWASSREIKAKRLDSTLEFQRTRYKATIEKKFQVAEAATHQYASLILQYSTLMTLLEKITNDRTQHEADFLAALFPKVETEIDRIIESGKSNESTLLALYFDFNLSEFFGMNVESARVEKALHLVSVMGELKTAIEIVHRIGIDNLNEASEDEFLQKWDAFLEAIKNYKIVLGHERDTYLNTLMFIKKELQMQEIPMIEAN
jgi:hypothetical protein